MAARLFGLRFFGGRHNADTASDQPWSADAPLNIDRPTDLMDFVYPPESAFAETERVETAEP